MAHKWHAKWSNPQKAANMQNQAHHCASRQKVRPMKHDITAPAQSESRHAQSYAMRATKWQHPARPQQHSERSKAKEKKKEHNKHNKASKHRQAHRERDSKTRDMQRGCSRSKVTVLHGTCGTQSLAATTNQARYAELLPVAATAQPKRGRI